MALVPGSVPKSTVQYAEADYTVAWVCALPVPEWQASRLMFDELHQELDIGIRAQHQYVYGKINKHNVVMGCLPTGVIGESSSASVMAEMSCIFPNLQFALLVGIGGGVWSERHDIRLGDVVVSQPSRDPTHGGVRQYDFGKAVPDQPLQDMSWLRRPADILLSGLGKLQSAPPGESQFLYHLATLVQHTNGNDEPLFARPESEDVLYKASTEQDSASPGVAVDRKTRKHTQPFVHYGLIASGNQVIKDAAQRDMIVSRLGDVLAFEMEAAGIVNQKVSCLVVRGICDYCDEHKSKEWQPYSAAAAAAWAKELLRNIAPWQALDSNMTNNSGHPMSGRHASSRRVAEQTSNLEADLFCESNAKHKTFRFKQNAIRKLTLDDISKHDAQDMLEGILARTFDNSLAWVKEHVDWIKSSIVGPTAHDASTSARLLCFAGKVGSGKTFAMSTFIKAFQHSEELGGLLIHHISPTVTLRPVLVFRSYARQLLQMLHTKGIACPNSVKQKLTHVFGYTNSAPDLAVLVRFILRPVIQCLGRVVVCFDGLDDYNEEEQCLILDSLHELQTTLVISCRSRRRIDQRGNYDRRDVDLDHGVNALDIRSFVEERLAQLSSPGDLLSDHTLRLKLTNELLERADGMFLWVHIQLDLIRYCRSLDQAFEVIVDLPDKLQQVFQRCISQQHLGRPIYEAELVERIVAVRQPLTLLELNEACKIISLNSDPNRSLTSVLQACCNLVVCQKGHLVPIHSSVTNFLFPHDASVEGAANKTGIAHRHNVAMLDLASASLRHIWQQMQSSVVTRTEIQVPAMHNLLPDAVQRLWPWRSSGKTAATHTLPLHMLPRASIYHAPAFLSYSIRTWADHTQGLYDSHPAYTVFREVATTISPLKVVHPWTTKTSKQLATSNTHLRGLLSYAVLHDHEPLLRIVVGPPALLRDEIFRHTLPDNENLTPVEIAVSAGHSNTAKLLIERGFADLSDSRGTALLCRAVTSGSIAITELLLSMGVPLFDSRANLPRSIVQQALAIQADANAFLAAVRSQHGYMMRYLITSAISKSSTMSPPIEVLFRNPPVVDDINRDAAYALFGVAPSVWQDDDVRVRPPHDETRAFQNRDAILRAARCYSAVARNPIGDAIYVAACSPNGEKLLQPLIEEVGRLYPDLWLLRECFACTLAARIRNKVLGGAGSRDSALFGSLKAQSLGYLVVACAKRNQDSKLSGILAATPSPSLTGMRPALVFFQPYLIALSIGRAHRQKAFCREIEEWLRLTRYGRMALKLRLAILLWQIKVRRQKPAKPRVGRTASRTSLRSEDSTSLYGDDDSAASIRAVCHR